VELLWESEWRALPAILLLLGGDALLARGVVRWRTSHRMTIGTPGKNLALIQAFRLVLGGLALLAIGAGWLWHIPILVAAGLVIGFEETIETSIAAYALQHEKALDESALPAPEKNHA
jgi:hypothetical protein